MALRGTSGRALPHAPSAGDAWVVLVNSDGIDIAAQAVARLVFGSSHADVLTSKKTFAVFHDGRKKTKHELWPRKTMVW